MATAKKTAKAKTTTAGSAAKRASSKAATRAKPSAKAKPAARPKATPMPPPTAGLFLIKSEPFVYSFDQLVTDGATAWTGVRNFEARNTLRAMKRGDLCLYYHSNEGKEIVGVARVTKPAYADPTSEEDWSAVDVAPVKRLTKPLTLASIKAHATLKEMALVRRSRISVVAVTRDEAKTVLALTETKLDDPRL